MSSAVAAVETLAAAQLDQLCINTIRTLSIDAVQQAKSGHPGTPMALAPLVYTIWNRVLRFDPQNPIWPNRDRFVLSNGHASMLSEGIRSRVVSMPSWEIFEHQPRAYRESVLPPNVTARVAVEQASTIGWERYVGTSGHVVGMNTFGASAPLKELQRKFGFEPDHVIAAAKEQLANSRDGNR